MNEMYKEKDAKLFNAVRALQLGNQEAYNVVYELSQRYIYKLIYDIVKDHHATEDLMQEAYLQVYNKIGTLQSPESFYAWAGRIATNMTLRYIQKNRHEVLAVEDEEGSTEFVFEKASEDHEEFIPESVIMDREKQRLLAEIIDSLSDSQKLTVQYFYFEDMSVHEIAQVMDCSDGTVKSRLNYARKAIKEAVEDLEKNKGTKLYSLASMPLFYLIFREALADTIMTAAGAVGSVAGVATQAGTAATTTTTTGVGATATTTGVGAAASTATGAGAGASAATATAGISLGVKVAIGVVAGLVVVGGGTAAAIHFSNSSQNEAAPSHIASDEENFNDGSSNGESFNGSSDGSSNEGSANGESSDNASLFEDNEWTALCFEGWNIYYSGSEEFDKAKECFEQSIENNPLENHKDYYIMAYAYQGMGTVYSSIGREDRQQALEYYKESIKYYEESTLVDQNKTEEYTTSYYSLGCCYLELGDTEKFVEYCDIAANMGTFNSLCAAYRLAIFYHGSNDELAEKYIQMAIDGGYPEAAELYKSWQE